MPTKKPARKTTKKKPTKKITKKTTTKKTTKKTTRGRMQKSYEFYADQAKKMKIPLSKDGLKKTKEQLQKTISYYKNK